MSRETSPLEIVGLGFCCQDDLLLLSEIPPPEGRATVLRRERQGGGMVATAMVAAARLGARAGFIGRVGDDAAGTQLREEFQGYGVDVSRLVTVPGARTHVTVVLVDARTGARSFLAQRGTTGEPSIAEVDRAYLQQARYLHLADASPAAVQAARWAKAAGEEVCFDGTHFHPSILSLLPWVDYLIVSRFFASEYVAHRAGRGLGRAAWAFAAVHESGPPVERGDAGDGGSAKAAPPGVYGSSPPVDHGPGAAEEVELLQGEQLLAAAERLREHGSPVVVVTEGEHGCWCASAEGTFHVPSFAVTPVVDTTGAGDVFHGAFLVGRARGLDLPRALRLASAAAALKCRALGGRAGIPSLDEALALAGLDR